MYKLREYQEMAADKGIISLNSKNNEIIVAPTASGKSLIITELCRRLDDATLILQPTKEILEQNYEKLQSYGVEGIGVYSASMKSKDIDKYTYATIGSIYKKPELFRHFKKIIVDECHLVNPRGFGMYKSFFRALGTPSVIGLTATPYRLMQRYYRDGNDLFYTSMLQVLNRIPPFFFKSFCFVITNKTMFEKGWLSPVDYVYPKRGIDISKIQVNTTGADFNEAAMERFMTSPDNIQKLVEAVIQEDANLKNNLIFCSSISHARRSAEVLAKMGYDCEVITGADPPEKRRTIIADFRSGKITRLLNCNVLSIGFDYPGLYGVTGARPTMSLGLYYQQLGRGIRLDPDNPGKRCKFIDVTGASRRMGRIETIRITKDGYKDQVETEAGVISGKPLFTFKITNQNKINRLTNKI